MERISNNIKHHPIYKRWSFIRQATTNPNCPDYEKIGALGWKLYGFHGGREFCEYVESTIGMPPTPNHVLSRIDKNEHYCRGNLKWVPRSEVLDDTTDIPIMVEYAGERHNLRTWSRLLNANYYTLHDRLIRQNMDVETAFSMRSLGIENPIAEYLKKRESENE